MPCCLGDNGLLNPQLNLSTVSSVRFLHTIVDSISQFTLGTLQVDFFHDCRRPFQAGMTRDSKATTQGRAHPLVVQGQQPALETYVRAKLYGHYRLCLGIHMHMYVRAITITSKAIDFKEMEEGYMGALVEEEREERSVRTKL